MRFFQLSIACYSPGMPFPPIIELISLENPVKTAVAIPGSKSITNRALALAALADGTTILDGALWSEDTQVMVDCLQKLGFDIKIEADPRESANRSIRVVGLGGRVPVTQAELFVANSGTTARFLAAMVCLGAGTYRFTGSPRMHERPQRALFAALRELGYSVESSSDKLPVVIHGAGPRPGARCTVSIEESSQFASALLLAATRGGWKVEIHGENAEESPYVRMTSVLIDAFPATGAFRIEPDASNASYFWGADWLLQDSEIRVEKPPASSLQIDAQFPRFIRPFAPTISRRDDLGDSIMTAIVLAPFADAPKTFTDLGRLRVQECERVRALRTELMKCGANVVEENDTLRITPGPIHGAEIETYGDHRIAMCFGMLGLRVPGMRIRNPEVVQKTFPNFWEKLSALKD